MLLTGPETQQKSPPSERMKRAQSAAETGLTNLALLHKEPAIPLQELLGPPPGYLVDSAKTPEGLDRDVYKTS